jgi:hypothetical protein
MLAARGVVRDKVENLETVVVQGKRDLCTLWREA